MPMKLALIADTYPPLRTSGAVQLRDLSREFVRQGFDILVILPSPDLDKPWVLENIDDVQILRLPSPRTKDINYFSRSVAEILMPFYMMYNFHFSPAKSIKFDGVVWYSPSIFLGPIAKSIKKKNACQSYLIIRDIFPDWAVDMGLMGRGLPYLFFDLVARYQYSVADVIGVQSRGNRKYFEQWSKLPRKKLEVLENWLAKPGKKSCSIRLNQTLLFGRMVFVYAGNLGVAQGLDLILDLAEKLQIRNDVGFLFVGRGALSKKLQKSASEKNLDNILFYDEIDPDEIPDLYAQCTAGIVSLDTRHKSHNIPGKFLTYMQCGLPVLANINLGNDLANLIRDKQVGQVCENNSINDLLQASEILLEQIKGDSTMPERCRNLFDTKFSVSQAVRQIAQSLKT